MILRILKNSPAIVLLLAVANPLQAQQGTSNEVFDWRVGQQLKELYLPGEVNRAPRDNDYNDPESDYSFTRMVEGPNVAVFWHREDVMR